MGNAFILAVGYPEATEIGLISLTYFPCQNMYETFLWRYIKDDVYRNNLKAIAELKTAFQEVIDSTDVLTLQWVV